MRFPNQPYSSGANSPLDQEPNVQCFELQSPSAIRPIYAVLEAGMKALGYPRQDFFAVSVILYEAVKNAFQHGTRGNLIKCVRVRCVLCPEEAWVEVEDDGPGFDLDHLPPPRQAWEGDRSGFRGLVLMRAFATWMSFNLRGNRVTLGRRRSTA
jgi:anti-sigma regulatory factor (Ser/Thr protein kinase)